MSRRNPRLYFKLRRSFTMGYPVFALEGQDAEDVTQLAIEKGEVHVYSLPMSVSRIDVEDLFARLRPLAKAMMRGATREACHGTMMFRLSQEAMAADAAMAYTCRHALEREVMPVDIAGLAAMHLPADAAVRVQA